MEWLHHTFYWEDLLKDCLLYTSSEPTRLGMISYAVFCLKKSNLLFSEILTSEWCRCIDTAKELDLGQWETFSGLNSFFEGHEKKDTVMAKLRKKLASLKASDFVLFVTHQVVITELTDEVPRSGEMVLYNSITKQKSRFMVDF